MRWRPELVTAPVSEPITLTEAKAHLRVTDTDDDTGITTLITVARQVVEEESSLALFTQTRKLILETWPPSGRIYLTRPPLQSITSVQYVDPDGVTRTFSSALYTVVGAVATPLKDLSTQDAAYLTPAYGQSWPSIRGTPDSVIVTYDCGWKTTAAIPEVVKQAILLTLADLYEHREPTITGTIVDVRPVVRDLLANVRCVHDFGEDCG